MEFDLILEQTQWEQRFVVQNRKLTDNYGNFAVWPARMPKRGELAICTIATLVLRREMGYAEAQRMKERCEQAWGITGIGLNYANLP